MNNPDPFRTYLQELQRNLSTGSATELTHRSALQALLEAIGDGMRAINEPQCVECGAPDYIITRATTPIGYVEAKDIGTSLDTAERSEQLGRYRASLNNLPLTSDRALFKALAEKGEELVALHPMESARLNQLITGFPVSGSNEVGRVRYTEPRPKEEPSEVFEDLGGLTPGRVYINKTQYFEGIEPDVWAFQIGGYQVLHKWLKDRRGRKLSFDDLFHYQKIVVALKETMRLMEEIDALIPSWPVE